MTLNVLLSFAQFEREVTGERIRDKIAASKKKGMWMGGTPPLGYRPHERTLVIDEAEAETVRYIFSRYLDLCSVHELKRDLDRDGIQNRYDNDRDGDGIANKSDPQPNKWNRTRVAPRANDMDRDGIRNQNDRDRDGDGVANVRDDFPNNPRRS